MIYKKITKNLNKMGFGSQKSTSDIAPPAAAIASESELPKLFPIPGTSYGLNMLDPKNSVSFKI
jgi:hypothetical protein